MMERLLTIGDLEVEGCQIFDTGLANRRVYYEAEGE